MVFKTHTCTKVAGHTQIRIWCYCTKLIRILSVTSFEFGAIALKSHRWQLFNISICRTDLTLALCAMAPKSHRWKFRLLVNLSTASLDLYRPSLACQCCVQSLLVQWFMYSLYWGNLCRQGILERLEQGCSVSCQIYWWVSCQPLFHSNRNYLLDMSSTYLWDHKSAERDSNFVGWFDQ